MMILMLPAGGMAAESPPPVMSEAIAAASAYAVLVFPVDCHDRADLIATGNALDDHEFSFPYRDETLTDEEPALTYRLFQLHCYTGAYNTGSVFLRRSPDGAFSVIGFPTPELKLDYADDSRGDRMKSAPRLLGLRTAYVLDNAGFDEKTGTITSRSSWRGMGDAWDSGTWSLVNGHFALTRFEVDPTYDSESGISAMPASYVVFGPL